MPADEDEIYFNIQNKHNAKWNYDFYELFMSFLYKFYDLIAHYTRILAKCFKGPFCSRFIKYKLKNCKGIVEWLMNESRTMGLCSIAVLLVLIVFNELFVLRIISKENCATICEEHSKRKW